MKKHLIITLILGFVFQFSYSEDKVSDEYKLVWEDNFDSATLNKDIWKIEIDGNGSGNNELQYYREENISLGKEPISGLGSLILTAKLEDFGGKKCTSGRLKTQGNMEFQYGKIEGRIKLPKTANGLWPAFWMMGGDYPTVGWPKCGEIDILETGNANGIKNSTQEYYFNGWFHWGESWNGGAYPNWGKARTNEYSIQDDFHLYTLIWSKDKISMYLDLDKNPDKEPYLEMGINGGTDPGQVGRYFHKPYYVILNLAIGGNFTGITGNSNISKITAFFKDEDEEPKMYVDYVKVYQKGEEGEKYTGPLPAGIEKISIPKFHVYVDSENGYVNAEGNDIPEQMTLYNLVGQKTIESRQVNRMNISSLPKGNYILKLKTKNGNEESVKINIQ